MNNSDEKIEKLKKLVELFRNNIKIYKSSNYDEANTRVDFIDKFFSLLDWDVSNEEDKSEAYRDVVREDKVEIEGKQKAPDYSFRIGGTRKFFVEAKKPAVNIKEEVDPSFQVRRYGWTAKLPLSILTDFEEFTVFDTRIKPILNDKSSVARIFYCNFEEYEKNFDFIYNTFSKKAIEKGSFDKYVEENKNKKGTTEIDKDFLDLIDNWRNELAKNIALRNSSINIYELNYAVQIIIDRLIFLRIAEDRNIEIYGTLQNISGQNEIYKSLTGIFKKADEKYNSNLFKVNDLIINLNVDDKILKSIIKTLYYPDCPYEFSILGIEILGNIYEQFLGKTIRLTEGHQAKVEEKPEVRKAGGVYYTPQYIVNYIVLNTVGEMITPHTPPCQGGYGGLTPEEIEKIKIVDPACGSGSFLLGAYDYLLKYHINYWSDDKNIKKALKEEKIYKLHENHYKLTIEEKQKILTNNIYGVDIDSQAVEVTKLSLLLKLLEDENKESSGLLFKHSDMKLLPNLDKNIKCGNSLIGSDFYNDRDLSLFGNDEMRKVNVFDWEKEFPEVFKNGGDANGLASPDGVKDDNSRRGFDVVIGNPPYVVVDFSDEEKSYFKLNYITAQYQLDLYIFFIEKGVKLLKENGYISFITPNSWLKNMMMSNCRLFLLENINFKKIVPKLSNIFLSASVDTLIFVGIKNNIRDKIFIEELNNFKFILKHQIDQKSFMNKEKYVFTVEVNENIEKIISKMKDNIAPLNDFFEITRGVNPYDIYTGQKREIIDTKAYHSNFKKNETFVPEIRGKHIKRYFYKWDEKHFISYGSWLAAPRDPKFFKNERIIFREILGKNFECTFIDEDIIIDRSLYIALPKKDSISQINIKYVLSLLCSKLLAFYFRYISNEFDDLFPKIRLAEFKLLPIKLISVKEQTIYVDKVNQIIEAQKLFHSAKIDNEKNLFKQKIDILDKQIDKLVYELYGLTEEDIRVVEEV